MSRPDLRVDLQQWPSVSCECSDKEFCITLPIVLGYRILSSVVQISQLALKTKWGPNPPPPPLQHPVALALADRLIEWLWHIYAARHCTDDGWSCPRQCCYAYPLSNYQYTRRPTAGEKTFAPGTKSFPNEMLNHEP